MLLGVLGWCSPGLLVVFGIALADRKVPVVFVQVVLGMVFISGLICLLGAKRASRTGLVGPVFVFWALLLGVCS